MDTNTTKTPMIPSLSFCIPCRNNIDDIKLTLRKNLEDNKIQQGLIDFVVVDFGSSDGLPEWICSEFAPELDAGYLKFYYTDELLVWKPSIAMNTVNYYADHEIIVCLACNQLTGYLAGQYIIQTFLHLSENVVLYHSLEGDGGISIFKKYFLLVGGYNEMLDTYQSEDLINRLNKIGINSSLLRNNNYFQMVASSEILTVNHTDRINICRQLSMHNIANGRLIANEGQYGIRKNVFDHHKQAIL